MSRSRCCDLLVVNRFAGPFRKRRGCVRALLSLSFLLRLHVALISSTIDDAGGRRRNKRALAINGDAEHDAENRDDDNDDDGNDDDRDRSNRRHRSKRRTKVAEDAALCEESLL